MDDLRSVLPAEYAKVKHIEKLLFAEHRKLFGLTDINAKYRYIQVNSSLMIANRYFSSVYIDLSRIRVSVRDQQKCRSLKTYGITFFSVREKLKGKNKLIPRLMGVTKDSVMRVDERTKEVRYRCLNSFFRARLPSKPSPE